MSESVDKVMNDISTKYNPKSVEEGIAKVAVATVLNKPELILAPIQSGAKEFEQRMGRPMTYLEMRSMFG